MKDSKLKYLSNACGKCDMEEIHNIWLQKTRDLKDGEIQYLRHKACGKYDVNKFWNMYKRMK